MPSSTLRSAVAPPVLSRPFHTFAKPIAGLSGSFSDALSVRELRDGRIIVSDSHERTLQVVDFREARTIDVRAGCDVGAPGRLLALPGDATLMVDEANARVFIIGPNAEPARSQRTHIGAFDRSRDVTAANDGVLKAKASDARGRLYYQGQRTASMAENAADDEWLPIVRYDPANGTHDTVAHVCVSRARAGATFGARGRSIAGVQAVSVATDWAVLPDGRVVLVRAKDCHVAIIQNRQRVATSSPEATEPIRLAAVWATCEGRIVVVRVCAAGDTVSMADVFDARGRIAGTLAIPGHARVTGFGSRCVYLNRHEPGRAPRLEKHVLPAFAIH